MIYTPLCDRIGIEKPIFQGGMAWVSDCHLAAAVSNAGGLGIISAMNADGEYLRGQIRACREMTGKPFGVNVMLMSPHAAEVARVILEEKVPVVTTGAGLPGVYMKEWVPAGIKVVPVVPSVAIARRVARDGAAAVIAEGCESGGHIGELTTMVLVPQVCDATDLPVLAAGGIGDGRGIAAAFMLGASGVQVGTRFLVAEECGVVMALHPDDPPYPIFGLPRVITCEENLDRYLSIVDSPSNALCLCTGSLGCAKFNDIPAMVRKYSAMGRIGFMHMRNVKIMDDGSFEERAHLSGCGSLDMYEITKALVETGFDGYVRPDHGRMIWGETGKPGYGLYDRALGAAYLNGLFEACEKSWNK